MVKQNRNKKQYFNDKSAFLLKKTLKEGLY